ncbi:50S ribosomal protein L17 [Candidatus Microgenomates bacterium]|nr:50S ribosomal protein L17 [Candidatus Microgenomates bacterium]
MSARAKLARKRDQRRLLVKNLATSLVMSEKITTTKTKAKLVTPYFERLITYAKQGGLHNRRQIMAALTTEEATRKLMDDLAQRFAKRHGGYTRMQSAGWRKGDDAELATISLTETKPEKKSVPKSESDKIRGSDVKS